VHSSLKSMGCVDGGAETVIRALQAAVGDAGTLLFPALTYQTVNRDNPCFSYHGTPVCVGLIPETFRHMEGVIRSLHPTHSVCAWGKLAFELTRDHQLDDTKVGAHSPYRKLPSYGGKVLMLGCGLKPFTFMHGMEEIARTPYIFTDKAEYTVEDREGRSYQTSIYDYGFFSLGYIQRYDRVADILTGGNMTSGAVHGAPSYLVDTAALQELAVKKMAEEPYYFVDKA